MLAFPFVRLDARLTEDVVTRELRRRSAAGETTSLDRYHAQREALYDLPPAHREPAFARLHARLFHELGFAEPVAAVVTAHASILAGVPALTLEPAPGPDDEGADLGAPGPGGRPAVARIATPRFLDGTLAPFLDHELMRLGDLVDPTFAHDSAALDSIAAHRRRAVQQRYRLAWGVSVDGRLARAGRQPLAERAEHRARLAAAFAPLARAAIDEVLQRLWAGPRPTHGRLLDDATAVPTHSARAEGAACPLCRFPTSRWASPPSPAMCEVIGRVVPGWCADDGLCARCFERFEPALTSAR